MSPSTYYNIVVLSEPSVGKTCFIDQFCYDKSFVAYDLDNSALSHEIIVDDQVSNLKLMDLSTSFLKPEQGTHPTEWAKRILAQADGIILLYDVTESASLEYITNQAYSYLWCCRRSGAEGAKIAGRAERESFGCVLVGNKQDLVATHNKITAVDPSLANEWAQTQGIRSIEIDSLTRAGPQSALKLLVLNIWKLERLGFMNTRDGHKQREETSSGKNKGSIQNIVRNVFQPSRA